MQFSLLCSFVCFSTLFLGTVFAGDGFSDNDVKPTDKFLGCTFTRQETNFFFEKHTEKHALLQDEFKLPGYLRWKSLGEVSEVTQALRTGDTIRAVVEDISNKVNPEKPKTIIIFATDGIKGVAAIRFAISHMDEKSKNNIVLFNPAKHARISVSDAFDEDLEKDLKKCETVVKVYTNLNDFADHVAKITDAENTFVLEGLSEIGFNETNNVYPEGALIMKIFFMLIEKGCKVIAIDDPVLHNIDFGVDTQIQKLKNVAEETQFEEPVLTEHKSCTNFKDIQPLETKFDGDAYTPFAVIFIGFLKPCYNGLKALEDVKYIYLGGHFLDALALDKFLEIESIKKRGECKGIDKSWFPTYKKDTVLFHIVKEPKA